jgi:hypothetical protein
MGNEGGKQKVESRKLKWGQEGDNGTTGPRDYGTEWKIGRLEGWGGREKQKVESRKQKAESRNRKVGGLHFLFALIRRDWALKSNLPRK